MLLLLWCLVLVFAVITWIDPPWMAEISRPGQVTEADWFSAAGVQRLRDGDSAGAVAAFSDSLRVYDKLQTRVHLAIALARAGQVDAGFRLLDQTLHANPGRFLRGVILFNMAELLFKDPNKGDAATTLYREALNCGAEPDKVHRRLGQILLAQTKLREALAAFGKSVQEQLDPAQPYRNMLQRATEGYSVVAAEEIEAQAAGFTPDDMLRYDLQTIKHDQQNDNPDLSITYNMLGYIHARLGELTAAREAFYEAQRTWPENQDATKNIELIERMIKEAVEKTPQP
jgi:tetratricopeptide (TPR) repeat protein